jgi:hypothetical protein
MLLFPLLRRAAIFALLAGSASSQGWTDGVITVESGINPRSNINSPGLPPNSTELALDSGIYTGYSRNLQNADIIPGWSYWAHATTFTPPSTAQGQLLEVRYVAVNQWGASRDFDVVIRDGVSGNVLATLTNQTAVLDTQNWQVIDTTSMNFIVGANDFTVELRPASACSGSNGFTLAYSATSNDGSIVSSVCTDAISDFASDPRELFLRAVVANGGPPTLSVSALMAGSPTTLSAVNLSANAQALIGYSFQGAGPVQTPFGLVDLSMPIGRITVNSDSQGHASVVVQLPASLAGATAWLQIIDLASGEIGAGLEVHLQ